MYVCIMYVCMYVFIYVCMYYVCMYELEYMTIYNRAHWIPSIPHVLTIHLLGNELSYHHLLQTLVSCF